MDVKPLSLRGGVGEGWSQADSHHCNGWGGVVTSRLLLMELVGEGWSQADPHQWNGWGGVARIWRMISAITASVSFITSSFVNRMTLSPNRSSSAVLPSSFSVFKDYYGFLHPLL